jgi:hypothetical protein
VAGELADTFTSAVSGKSDDHGSASTVPKVRQAGPARSPSFGTGRSSERAKAGGKRSGGRHGAYVHRTRA